MKVAAMADLHCRVAPKGMVPKLLENIATQADVLLLPGDLTDNGLIEEAEVLVEELAGFPIPILAVLGNHDHEGGHAAELVRILQEGGLHILDGTAIEIEDVGFVGTKGFCGGFENTLIMPFGEAALKTFINTSINEAMQLENALAKLECKHKVVILHYAPIRETLEGEPVELFPFLGTSRLSNACDRQGVDVIVHGHAHHGSPMGYTQGRVPVHNVSRFVQERHNNSHYCLFEL